MEKQTNLLFNFNKPEIGEKQPTVETISTENKKFNFNNKPLGFFIGVLWFTLTTAIISATFLHYKNEPKAVYLPVQVSTSGYGSDVSQQQAAVIGTQLSMATEQFVNKNIEAIKGNEAVLLTEYLKEVKAITPKELADINSFVNEVKQMEHTRLNELTLKIKYVVNKNPNRYTNDKEALSRISQLKIDTSDYYNEVLVDINRTYKIAKNSNPNDYKNIDIKIVNSAIDSLKDLLLWKNYKDLNIKPTLQDNDEIIVEWAPSIVDQDGIEDYLAKNKKFISQK